MFQKQDGRYFVLFSNGPDHWKTKLLASLDHFIHEHNTFSLYIKWSRVAKSSVLKWSGPSENKIKQTPTIPNLDVLGIPNPTVVKSTVNPPYKTYLSMLKILAPNYNGDLNIKHFKTGLFKFRFWMANLLVQPFDNRTIWQAGYFLPFEIRVVQYLDPLYSCALKHVKRLVWRFFNSHYTHPSLYNTLM